jgi:PEGA domain-containing protein
MSLPPDSIYVPERPESAEDPLEFFPSEQALRVRRTSAVYARGRRFAVLTITLFVRWFAVLMTASRRWARFAVVSGASAASSLRALRLPRWRLPALRLPALRLPNWRLPDWQLPAWQLRAWQLPRWRVPAWREGAWSITVSAFACGVVVGGFAVWLMGAPRQAAVAAVPSQQTPREVPRATWSPVAPVATAFGNTPVVQVAAPETAAATRTTANRRPQFRGSLIVNSRPSGARVFVNGRSVGQTPLVLRNQPAGSRAIRVALDGYEPWSSAVQVVADTETRLRAELKAQRAAAQP